MVQKSVILASRLTDFWPSWLRCQAKGKPEPTTEQSDYPCVFKTRLTLSSLQHENKSQTFYQRGCGKARGMLTLCLCPSLRTHVWTRSRSSHRHIVHSLQHSFFSLTLRKLSHLCFSTTAMSEMGKSIYCSCLLVTDHQNHRLFEQEDTLEIIQCGGFPNFCSQKILFIGMQTENNM